MAPSEIARKHKLYRPHSSNWHVAACLIVFFQLSQTFRRLLVVHGVGFAKIRGHHAFVIAAAVLLLLLLLLWLVLLLVMVVIGW